MGVPAIRLNLAPPPTLWRLHHNVISWVAFAVGAFGLGISLVATIKAYQEADLAGQKTVAITDQARTAQRQQARVLDELREIKVDHELPRWRLAERILTERALPWSRITAELERSLVQDVRIKSIQRVRGNDQSVQLKLRGEARSQSAEENFIVSLQKNFAFAQVILEREAELTNTRGSLEFDYNLHLNVEPPPYELLPKYGPERKHDSTPVVTPPPPKPEVRPVQQEQKPVEQPVQQPVQQPSQPAPQPQTARPPSPSRSIRDRSERPPRSQERREPALRQSPVERER